MTKKTIELGFIPQHYPEGTHMCLIYKSEEERKKVISRFLKKGVETGEKVSYFAVKTTEEELLKQIRDAGANIDNETLDVSDAEKTYCPDGKFIPDQMLNTLKAYYENCMEEGYESCRVSGEMHWALKGMEGSDRLMEYESKANIVFETHPITAICQYDARLFDQKTLSECLKVHPYMIVNGIVIENPFYITSEEYLSQ